ncbi:PH-domain-containing protein [Hesseltinella vesiculosa]|uniref:PH-domain-containing protein n=1 Tax=Hesseltinella vesiculosa TaxID=101127 RepID=A0A1X2GHN1_9FUNG|nr:PH-domain-containing protein [Hesseltinella vesiculosa]
MSKTPEIVYAIHNFEAENEDEITFFAGEPIVVIEKDEKYLDGWWQGRDQRGHVGLFPMNYTSPGLPVGVNGTMSSSTLSLGNFSDKAPATNRTPAPVVPSPSPQPPVAAPQTLSPVTPSFTNNNSDFGRLSPESWDVNNVCAWLDSVGLGNAKDTFIEQEITGDVLLDLSMDSLKELGIPAYGRRYKIMLAINKLTGNDAPVPKSSVSSQLPSSVDKRYVSSVISSTTSSSLGTSNNLVEAANHIRSTLSSPVDSDSLYQFPRKAPAPPSSVSSSSNGQESQPRMRPISSTSAGSSSNNSVHRSNTFNTTSSSGAGTLKNGGADLPPQHPSYQPRSSRQPSASISAPTNSRPPTSQPFSSGHDWFQQEMSTRINQAPEQKLSIASVDTMRPRPSIDEFQAPEHEGWLHKQSDRYKTWNKRWFVLKGNNLFYFKSPKDVRVKGIINLRGYRVIVDETIHSNKYCFKTQHDQERTFFFYTDTKESMRTWLQALMKATIVRDFTSPVMSSNQVATVPLDVAQRMRPRPPSVLMYKASGQNIEPSMTRVQEEDEEEETIPASAAAAASATLQGTIPHRYHQQRDDEDADDNLAYTLPVPPSHSGITHHDSDEDNIDPFQRDHRPHSTDFEDDESGIHPFSHSTSTPATTAPASASERTWSNIDYLKWINQYLPDGKKVVDLSTAFRNGDTLILLLESLSSKVVRRTPDQKGGSVSMKVLDNIVAAFKFMGREGVVVDGRYTIKDIFGGHEDKIMDMVDAIKMWADTNGYTNKGSSNSSSYSSGDDQVNTPSLSLPDLKDSFSQDMFSEAAIQRPNMNDSSPQLQNVA